MSRSVKRFPLIEALFFATVFTVTFAKIHWSLAGDLSLSDVLTAVFLVAFVIRRYERSDWRFARTAAITFAFFIGFLLVYLIGFFNLDTTEALDQWAKGMIKFLLHFLFLAAGVALVLRRGERFFWKTLWVFFAGIVANAVYGLAQLGDALGTGGNLDASVLSPLTGGASQINIYGAVQGQSVYRPNALTGDPNHLGIELTVPLLVLLPIYLRLDGRDPWRNRLMLLLSFLFVMELSTLSRSGLFGLACGLLVLLIPYRRHLFSRRCCCRSPAWRASCSSIVAWRAHFFEAVLHSRVQTGRPRHEHAPRRLLVHPADPPPASAVRARAEQLLRLLRVRHRADELRPALVLRAAHRRDRPRGISAIRCVRVVPVPPAPADAGDRPLAAGAARPVRRPRPAAGVGTDGGSGLDARRERLLPDDLVLLLLRLRAAVVAAPSVFAPRLASR